MRRLRIFLLSVIFLQTGIASSQTVSNIHVAQQDEQVFITYDLDKDADTVTLQFSINGEQFTDIDASGDVGLNIKLGFGKRIIYKPQTALFCGACVFRVKIGQIPSFVDPRDGNIYKMVTIGNQIWLAENLNYATSSGSWCYDNNPKNCKLYGRLYNWETAKKVCPKGWHLPSDEEWMILTDYLGGKNVAGGKMKSIGTQLWLSPNTGATNSSGFSGLPGGNRYNFGSFNFIGYYGYWWSSSENDTFNALYRYLDYSNGNVFRNINDKPNGFSVRCLRD